jgi:hypothetical protein
MEFCKIDPLMLSATGRSSFRPALVRGLTWLVAVAKTLLKMSVFSSEDFSAAFGGGRGWETWAWSRVARWQIFKQKIPRYLGKKI